MTFSQADNHRLGPQRLAVTALFFVFGVLVATWAVYLPTIKQATGASNSQLGTLLLLLGAGAVLGMQFSGHLIDRHGSTPVALLGSVAMLALIFPPVSAHSMAAAAGGAVCLGVATGTTDVGMNAAAVLVERRYQRPIMASFHAVFSIGTVVGALTGAACFALTHWHFAAVVVSVVIGLALTATVAVLLLRYPVRDPADVGVDATAERTGGDVAPRSFRIAALAILAFLLMLAEGSAMDWSNLHAQQHLHAPAWMGSLALGCFVVAMTVGRFTVDRAARHVGPVTVLRIGSLLAAAGFIAVMASSVLPVTLIGWAAAGVGLAGGVPQVFSAAGNLGTGSGKSLSKVVGTGYVAILAGPATLGWLAERTSLNTALVVPAGAALICAGMSAVVGRTATTP